MNHHGVSIKFWVISIIPYDPIVDSQSSTIVLSHGGFRFVMDPNISSRHDIPVTTRIESHYFGVPPIRLLCMIQSWWSPSVSSRVFWQSLLDFSVVMNIHISNAVSWSFNRLLIHVSEYFKVLYVNMFI
jgi:hypothetical protein